MSTLRTMGLLLLGLSLPSAAAAEPPGLGVPALPDDIPYWTRAVFPDGRGLPVGQGSVSEGAELYQDQCSACHGAQGEGPVKTLVGGIGSLASPQPLKSVGSHWPFATTLFGYVRVAMPANAPKSLSADETYALTAYILSMNGIIGEDAVLDEKTLPAIEMPASGLFLDHWEADGERPY